MPVPIQELRAWALLTLLLVALSGCALFRPVPPQGLEVNLRQTTLTAERFGELQILSIFVIRNPNDFDVEIIETERVLRLEDQPLKILTDHVPRQVPAHGEIEFKAHMSLAGEEMVDSLQQTPEEASIPGSLQLALRSNQRELDPATWYSAQWSGSLPIMVRPTLHFKRIDRQSLSALQADLELITELENPNNYAIHLRSLSIDLKINGVSLGKIEAPEMDEWIPSDERVQVKVSHSIRLDSERSEIYQILAFAKSFKVEVTGEAIIGFDSPLSPAKLTLSATGFAKP